MTSFATGQDLHDAEFTFVNLRRARFVECDLSGAVMRGIGASGMDIDAPWLDEGEGFRVNGVDIVAFVTAELDRRFPGREERGAEDPEALRSAWAAAERAWQTFLDRVAAMPEGTVDASVAGEWSLAQTLRHLVLATDMWLGRGILQADQPFHPLGLMYDGAEGDGHDLSVFTSETPTHDEVLAARADRVAMVRDFLAAVTADQLAEARANPHSPEHPETVRSCLHTILHEEWEHLRFATRDLDALEAGRG